jgi:hypothetical protein
MGPADIGTAEQLATFDHDDQLVYWQPIVADAVHDVVVIHAPYCGESAVHCTAVPTV